MEQQLRFCKTPDGVRLAYAITGKGPPLVRTAHWLTHVQYDLESPVWSTWIREFSKTNTYIRYDERGCGLSDWDVPDFSFDAWVRDLETVVDATGLERFSLLGVSQGGSVSVAYAVKHPERVERLILCGTIVRGWAHRNLSTEERLELKAVTTLMRIGWGKNNPATRRFFTSYFIPDGSLQQMRWFDDLERVSTSAKNAVRFMAEFDKIDIRSLAPKVTVPTLVVHVRGDLTQPFEHGMDLASLIPNAHFVPLEGRNHIFLEDDENWKRFLNETRQFLGVREPAEEAPVPKGELGITGWLRGPKNAQE